MGKDFIFDVVERLALLVGGWFLLFNELYISSLICFVGLIIINNLSRKERE